MTSPEIENMGPHTGTTGFPVTFDLTILPILAVLWTEVFDICRVIRERSLLACIVDCIGIDNSIHTGDDDRLGPPSVKLPEICKFAV